MEYIGGIAGLIFFAKIIAHLILLSKTDKEFTLITANPFVAKKQASILLLPIRGNVPNNYRLLKIFINTAYVVAVLGILFFLIWNSFFRKHG